MFLDWAKSRRLLDGYHLIIYHQTGPRQGVQTTIDRLPRHMDPEAERAVARFLKAYRSDETVQDDERYVTAAGQYVHRTPISRSYDINLGVLVFLTRHRTRQREIDKFIRFMEATVAIRKQAIAFALNPPFVDLALQNHILLDTEVGNTVVRSIEANETHVLSFDQDEDAYKTAFSTAGHDWTVRTDDPIAIELDRRSRPIYFQDTRNNLVKKSAPLHGIGGSLRKAIDETGCRSSLVFTVSHETQRFALVICLFRRPHAVSLTETAIASRLQVSLSEYYRLGFERHRSARASLEAEEVEKKVRQALLIADIMHDATDDLIAARASLDTLRARTELEKTELESAKKSLKHLQATARLFRFMFSAGGSHSLSVAEAMTSGKDYYSKVSIRELFETLVEKYDRILREQKINVVIQAPPHFSVHCMEVSVVRAIDNCVKNAIRHLKEKGAGKRTLTLGARGLLIEGEVMAELSVHDTGVGIEPSVLSRVHRPFVSFSGGMGLGLAIVGTVCDIHGGRLEVTSQWGSWTRVALRLPQTSTRAKGK